MKFKIDSTYRLVVLVKEVNKANIVFVGYLKNVNNGQVFELGSNQT
jgi:hypothetical protein